VQLISFILQEKPEKRNNMSKKSFLSLLGKWIKIRILSYVFYFREIFLDVYDTTSLPSNGSPPEEVCRLITEKDRDSVEQKFGKGAWESFSRKMKLGFGYAVLSAGEIAGYIWFLDKRCPNEGAYPFYYTVQPGENCVYLSGGYILPLKRSFFLVRKVLLYTIGEMKRKGFRFIFTTHDSENLSAEKIMTRFGFKTAGSCMFYRVAGIKFKKAIFPQEFCRLDP
jgi:hypothetical protein